MDLYQNRSSYPKVNAQENLKGKTHYVDDNTLRGFRSRIISARATDNGLLFAIVTSDSLNYEHTKRGFRFVIFDLFGNVLRREPRGHDNQLCLSGYRTSAQATKAMWAALNEIDAHAVTLAAIERAKRNHDMEMNLLRTKLSDMAAKAAA